MQASVYVDGFNLHYSALRRRFPDRAFAAPWMSSRRFATVRYRRASFPICFVGSRRDTSAVRLAVALNAETRPKPGLAPSRRSNWGDHAHEYRRSLTPQPAEHFSALGTITV
jgi:hypothetical protein